MIEGAQGSILLNALANDIHKWARGKGFWDHEELTVMGAVGPAAVPNPSIALEKIALMHSEASEMLESERDGDTNTCEEAADLIIRVLDFCAWRGYDIHQAIFDKMAVNAKRPHKHGRQI